MARLIPWPAEAVIQDSPIQAWNPGQASLDAERSGASQVISFDSQHWRGLLSIGIVRTEEQAAAVEAFLVACRGRENYFELPVYRPSAGIAPPTSVRASGITDGLRWVQLEAVRQDVTVDRGTWLRIGSGAFHVIDVQNPGDARPRYLVEPDRVIAAGSVVDNLESILARLEEDPTLAHTPDFIGPWSIRWREYRDPPTLALALPRVLVPIEDRELEIGAGIVVGLGGYFTEPGGGVLTFEASAAGNRAQVALIGGGNLRVTGLRAGVETVNVRVIAPNGESLTESFQVAVRAGAQNQPPTRLAGFDQLSLLSGQVAGIALAGHFTDADSYEVGSTNPTIASGVVTAAGELEITAHGPGDAILIVTARAVNGLTTASTLAVVVSLLGEEHLMTLYLQSGTPALPPVTTPLPTLLVALPDISLDNNPLSQRTINLDLYFENVTTYGVTRAGSSVTATVEGRELIIRPVAAGDTTVTVIGQADGVSARDSFTARVTAAATPFPTLVVPLPDISLDNNPLSQRRFNLDLYFENVTTYSVSRAGSSVTAAIEGRELIIRPVAAGDTTVTVVGQADGVSAQDSFTATVAGAVPLPAAPVLENALPDLALQNSALEARRINLDSYFSGATAYAANVVGAAATAVIDGSELTVTPAAVGQATVTVTATNAQGDTPDAFQVTITAVPPSVVPPTITRELPDLTLQNSALVQQRFDLNDYFDGADTYLVSQQGNSVTAAVEQNNELWISVNQAGLTTVTVTARNTAGTIADAFQVNVLGPAIPIPTAPVLENALPDLALQNSALQARRINLDSYFSGATAYTADVVGAAATAVIDGSELTVTPAAVGQATVTVTATNTQGDTPDAFQVTITGVPLPAVPPSLINEIPDFTLQNSVIVQQRFDLNDYFAGADTYLVSQQGNSVAAAVEQDNELWISVNREGLTTVTVTAQNAAGNITDTFQVNVLGAPLPLPTIRSAIADQDLFEDDNDLLINLFSVFEDADQFSVVSSDPSVATVMVRSALPNLVINPIAAGATTITVTGANARGSINDIFDVTVAARVVRPTIENPIADQVRFLDEPPFTINLLEVFDGATSYTATTSISTRATVVVAGNVLAVYPGTLSGAVQIRVTARNSAGSVEDSFNLQLNQRPVTNPPTLLLALPDIVQPTNSPVRFIDLRNHFEDATSYTVARSGGLGPFGSIAGHSLGITAPTATVTPATLTVTARNSAGSIQDAFTVEVIHPPEAALELPDLQLLTSVAGRSIGLPLYFRYATSYTASTTGSAASANVIGDSLSIAPLQAGVSTVTVTALNAVGTVSQTFTVTVTAGGGGGGNGNGNGDPGDNL